jgi:hypothetical protein
MKTGGGGIVKTSSRHQARLGPGDAAISRPTDERTKQQKQAYTFYQNCSENVNNAFFAVQKHGNKNINLV